MNTKVIVSDQTEPAEPASETLVTATVVAAQTAVALAEATSAAAQLQAASTIAEHEQQVEQHEVTLEWLGSEIQRMSLTQAELLDRIAATEALSATAAVVAAEAVETAEAGGTSLEPNSETLEPEAMIVEEAPLPEMMDTSTETENLSTIKTGHNVESVGVVVVQQRQGRANRKYL